MSGPLELAEISDLRAYERQRDEFRREVIALKRVRRVAIGPVLGVVFENRTTMRFQIQEMARAEKMVTDEAIAGELAAYNPLIPGFGEISLTMFIELTSEAELREWLPRLVGIERSVLLRIGAGGGAVEVRGALDPTHASQLTREEVTASVHYVRLRVPDELVPGFAGRPVSIGTDHPHYGYLVELAAPTKESLAADWR